MRQIFNWFSRLIKMDSSESSKRFLAIFSIIVFVTYLVFRFSDHSNVEIILGEILSFVLVLFGVAAWQNQRPKK